MKIIITGINGFIGTNLSHNLKLNHEIYGLDIIPTLHDGMVQIYKWQEVESIPQVDVIIHLAGKGHDTNNITAEQEYFDINVGLTKRVFDHFLSSKAQKFIFFSSVKAVADSVEGDELTEETLPEPRTPYGKSKLEAERYILTQPIPNDKQVYILRPCMIHGPGNKGNLNLLYNLVSKGIPWPLGSFENQRSFCSIDNVCFTVNELIDRTDIGSGIYHIADDEPVSTNDIIRLISLSLKKKTRVLNLPERVITAIAKAGDHLRLPLNTERLKKLTESYVVSNSKIKRAMGKPLPVSATDGLLHTFLSFKQ